MNASGEARVRVRDARLAGIELSGSYETSPGVKGAVEIRRAVRDR